MMNKPFSSSSTWLLLPILAVALLLRLYALDFQSFWIDEIHTTLSTAPELSWMELFRFLRCCDQHPPLFFIVEKIAFLLFGCSETIARGVAALAGTLSVWAIFLLGKELYHSRLGLTAAALSCINYFSIEYSQEARPYAFALLFSILSWLFLVKFIKQPNRKQALLYALFALLLLYSHYFSFFVLAAQITVLLVFGFQAENRKTYFHYLLLSGLVIALGYAPWIPVLLEVAAIRSFWIAAPEPGFAVAYFYEYFGNSELLRPFLLLLLVSWLIHSFLILRQPEKEEQARRISMGFMICLAWISVTLLLPYLRSILLIPMLVSRYTIVVLPAFLLLLAYGLELIQQKTIRYSLLSLFLLLSWTDIAWIKHYYSTVNKTQFREVAEVLARDSLHQFPVLSEPACAPQHPYYFHQFGVSQQVLYGSRKQLADSVMNAKAPGFWVIGMHTDSPPETDWGLHNGQSYVLSQQHDLFNAWARQYTLLQPGAILLDAADFAPGSIFDLDGDKVTALWEGTLESRLFQLPKGKYTVQVLAKGTPVAAVYPYVVLSLNKLPLGIISCSGQFEQHTAFHFEMPETTMASIRLKLDNDAADPARKEDRNCFIRHILITPVE